MKLSLAAELAIQGAVVLCEQYGQGPTTLADICELRGLPREYLAKVFALLTRANILTPIRGKKGGYILAHDPKEISLLQIIEAVEGRQVLNRCQFDPPKCDNVDNCKMREVWSELQDIFDNKLSSVSLADCI